MKNTGFIILLMLGQLSNGPGAWVNTELPLRIQRCFLLSLQLRIQWCSLLSFRLRIQSLLSSELPAQDTTVLSPAVFS